VGLAGLLSFNSTAVQLSLGSLSAVTAPRVRHDHDARTDHDERAANERFDSAHHDESGTTTTTTAAPSVARSATGTATNYSYGILAVKVTVSGSTITNVSIASINDGGNPRSEYIDQQSIPSSNNRPERPERQYPRRLRCQLHDRGFEQSLQSALSKLGL